MGAWTGRGKEGLRSALDKVHACDGLGPCAVAIHREPSAGRKGDSQIRMIDTQRNDRLARPELDPSELTARTQDGAHAGRTG